LILPTLVRYISVALDYLVSRISSVHRLLRFRLIAARIILSPVLISLSFAIASPGAGLDWKPAPDGSRSAAVTPVGVGRDGFTTMTSGATGITFSNILADASAAANQVLQNGSGVALGDIDGDGWCDIYLCRLEGPNVLYRNLGGWKFEDVTAGAGVACDGDMSTGAVLADLDGDGDLDLLVNSVGGGTRCFFNDGRGVFRESNSGLQRRLGSMSMALGDIDGDGDLDLYVANYRTTTVRSTGIQVLNINGRRSVRPQDRDQLEITSDGRLLEHGERDALYLNDGKGSFTPVSWTDGRFTDEDGKTLADAPRDWGLSVMMRDINGDGSPDIYVCNDFWTPDRIWLNDGKGLFRALPRLAMRNSSTFSMGADFADFNRDGFDDFIVLDMLSRDHRRRMRQRGMTGEAAGSFAKIEDRPQVERNTLFINRGDGTYAELAQLAGVRASEWSWGVVCLDVDLDGYEDILITTGHDFDTQDADTSARLDQLGPKAGPASQTLLHYPRLSTPCVAFRNRGDLTFEEMGSRWGFDVVGVSHGMAVADLDNDGDLDVIVNRLNAPVSLYRNDSAAPRVGVRLKGRMPNTRGIGAKIRMTGGPVAQSQEMMAGGHYLSGDDAMRVFAGASSRESLRLEVTWRNGSRSVLTNVIANRIYEIDETSSSPPKLLPSPKPAAPLFEDVSELLGHTHHDEPFNDFARQSLLSRMLSQLGPGVSWFDFDGDGFEDLAIGTGRGGTVGLFRNDGRGGFGAVTNTTLSRATSDDIPMIVGVGEPTSRASFWIVQSSYETTGTNLPSATGFGSLTSQSPGAVELPNLGGSPGPIAVADVDGDGDLDLFVGGRCVPGRYPEAPPSRLYVRQGDTLVLAQEWSNVGMVSGAVFSDLNADGFPELILACDWGPIRLFENTRGKFHEITEERGLGGYRGWWNGVTTADFDGDGRLDIVASNWGRNHAQQEFLRDELHLYHGDISGRGAMEMVEAYVEPARKLIVPVRSLDHLAQSMPFILERVRSYQAYGEASVADILSEQRMKLCRELRVNWLDSTVFLARSNRFEVRPLPGEAQWSPAFGICTADFDGDGRQDLVLAQNFFDVESETSRYDAGRGLLLKGDGQGGFTPVSGAHSGIVVYGEQRGLAAADFDGDGRVDLALAQNSAATRLFRNARGVPGVRLRLRGPAGNPHGIGATITARSGGRVLATSEVKAGSGYWSQDSALQVIPALPAGATLSIRWPGGREAAVLLPAGAAEVVVDFSGNVRVVR
jgi:hypothetical protein